MSYSRDIGFYMSKSEFDQVKNRYKAGLNRFKSIKSGDAVYFTFGWGDIAKTIVIEVHPYDKYIVVDDLSIKTMNPNQVDRIKKLNSFYTQSEFENLHS